MQERPDVKAAAVEIRRQVMAGTAQQLRGKITDYS